MQAAKRLFAPRNSAILRRFLHLIITI